MVAWSHRPSLRHASMYPQLMVFSPQSRRCDRTAATNPFLLSWHLAAGVAFVTVQPAEYVAHPGRLQAAKDVPLRSVPPLR